MEFLINAIGLFPSWAIVAAKRLAATNISASMIPRYTFFCSILRMADQSRSTVTV